MSKSLEALERLCKVKIYQKEASAYDYLGKEIYKEEINLIKQDLERLEQLEQENLELKQDIVSFEDYSYDLDCEKEQLKKENQELKEQLELKKFKEFILLNGKLDKLEKAIEILKEYYKFQLFPPAMDNIPEISISTDWEHCISQQEYDLLKEVLKDDK
jgi:ABC-type phosphate transport system auxiliary subunit